MILEKYTDAAGKVRVLWQTASGAYLYKFDAEPSIEELTALGEASDIQSALSSITPLGLNITDSRDAINAFIEHVRQNPTMILSAYNTYLSTLTWYDAAAVRNFVYLMAKRLSERQEVSLSGWTEGVVVREVRDYIVDTDTATLNRLIE